MWTMSNYDLIVHKLSEDLKCINIYPLGDVHIGSEQFNEKLFDKWINMVLDDKNGYVVLVGDILDNGLKNSKTNSYEATMRPREQKRYATEKLRPIRDKILGAVNGNHEYRSVNASDDSPFYDVMCKLDLEHLFRENMNFIKISFGKRTRDRQFTYVFVLAHGGSKAKVEKISYAIDGMDVLVTGHTHTPSNDFPMKLVIDSRNDNIIETNMISLVVPSFQSYGGYGMRGLYLPKSNNRFPILKLSGEKKGIELLWK